MIHPSPYDLHQERLIMPLSLCFIVPLDRQFLGYFPTQHLT